MWLSDLILFCVAYVFVTYYKVSASDVEGYYWRDYAGDIPNDAMPGGTEKAETTYIGQVLHKDLLVPAKIIPSMKKAAYEWGYQEHVTSQNIKILCTNHPEQFKWVKTTSSEFGKLNGWNLIVGGYEPGATLYIGRTYSEGEIVLGKLLVNDNVVLHTSKDGKGVQNFLFEVLAYINTSKAGVKQKTVPLLQKCTTVKFYC